MPELPDLTIFARNLGKALEGRRVESVLVRKPARVSVPEAAFSARVAGQTIDSVSREGKETLFHLSNGAAFSVHLMLMGRFAVGGAAEAASDKHGILSLALSGCEALSVSDPHGQARVTLDPKPSAVPDALSDAFTLDFFLRLLRKNATKNIKALLVDQAMVRGIGNAYVDEILYAANIAPGSVTGRIPAAGQRALYEAIPSVLRGAIETLERLTPDAIAGEERSFLKVHNRNLTETEDGEPIIVREVADRRTYYTAKQKLYL